MGRLVGIIKLLASWNYRKAEASTSLAGSRAFKSRAFDESADAAASRGPAQVRIVEQLRLCEYAEAMRRLVHVTAVLPLWVWQVWAQILTSQSWNSSLTRHLPTHHAARCGSSLWKVTDWVVEERMARKNLADLSRRRTWECMFYQLQHNGKGFPISMFLLMYCIRSI